MHILKIDIITLENFIEVVEDINLFNNNQLLAKYTQDKKDQIELPPLDNIRTTPLHKTIR